MIRPRLGNAGGHSADAYFRDKLHRNPRALIHIFQIMDELRQILD